MNHLNPRQEKILREQMKEQRKIWKEKNIRLDEYCLDLDLHKSMFLIDMLSSTYEFSIKKEEVVIFKKLNNSISEEITRKELIYFIQVEMVQKNYYHYPHPPHNSQPPHNLIKTFYGLFNSVDSIHKAIDNIIYLEKFLNKRQLSNAVNSIDKAINTLEKHLNQEEETDEGLIKESEKKESPVEEHIIETSPVVEENDKEENDKEENESTATTDAGGDDWGAAPPAMAGPALWAKHSSKKKITCKKKQSLNNHLSTPPFM